MFNGPLVLSLKNSEHESDYSSCGFLYIALTIEKLLNETFEDKNEKIKC